MSWGLHQYNPKMLDSELVAVRDQLLFPLLGRDEVGGVPQCHQECVSDLSFPFN